MCVCSEDTLLLLGLTTVVSEFNVWTQNIHQGNKYYPRDIQIICDLVVVVLIH